MRILIVDDQRGARRLIRQILGAMAGVEIFEADAPGAALEIVGREVPDVVLLDVRLSASSGDRRGLELLGQLRAQNPAVDVVMVTASSAIGEVRGAMRLGAADYVLKDELSPETLIPIIAAIRERNSLRGEVLRLRATALKREGLSAMVGSSAAIERVRGMVRRVADADATVLLRGETGVGKELVARTIHDISARRREPFVPINCSALPHSLMESLIFGHERGAFTGAAGRARGQLELARGGTVLLDEIAEMSLDMQVKLLRVIEDRAFRPLGAATEQRLAARLIVATHADLERRMREGRFREDLFFRINVVAITVPTLEERRQDIPALVHALASRLPRRLRFTEDAIAWLSGREWPGNVRELRNVIERVAVLAESDLVTPDVLDLIAGGAQAAVTAEAERLATLMLASQHGPGSRLLSLERIVLQKALEMSDGNLSAAARRLGIERRAFKRRWARFGGEVDDDEGDDDGDDDGA